MQHTFFHPWHSLSYGEQAPETVNSIIEIQRGSKAKYELEKKTGFLILDRVLASNLQYPFHYGFIPQTYCEDKDPLDILILCSEQLVPLSIVEATVLGAIDLIDGGEQDDKIIARATHDPFMKHINSLDDLAPETINTIKNFFQEYKKGEQKEVIVQGLESKQKAHEIIQKSIALYKSTFKE